MFAARLVICAVIIFRSAKQRSSCRASFFGSVVVSESGNDNDNNDTNDNNDNNDNNDDDDDDDSVVRVHTRTE